MVSYFRRFSGGLALMLLAMLSLFAVPDLFAQRGGGSARSYSSSRPSYSAPRASAPAPRLVAAPAPTRIVNRTTVVNTTAAATSSGGSSGLLTGMLIGNMLASHPAPAPATIVMANAPPAIEYGRQPAIASRPDTVASANERSSGISTFFASLLVLVCAGAAFYLLRHQWDKQTDAIDRYGANRPQSASPLR